MQKEGKSLDATRSVQKCPQLDETRRDQEEDRCRVVTREEEGL